MLLWLKKEKIEEMLQVMSIDIIAQKLNISKWMLYKYTSYHKIDVWKCKEALIVKRNYRLKLKEKDPYYNIVYGSLNKNILEKLNIKYSIKQLCWLFNIEESILLSKAANWNVTLYTDISKGCCKECNTENILYDGYCLKCKNNLKALFEAQTDLGEKNSKTKS